MSGTAAPGAPLPELPFVEGLLDLARSDLDASRTLLQRLLATGDTLLATSLTVASLFAGLAFSSHRPAIVAVPSVFVLALGFLDGVNWVHFQRTSARIRNIELLVRRYLEAIQETGVGRAMAIGDLRHEVDRYRFGSERSLGEYSLLDVWGQNRSRLRWWFYGFTSLAMVVLGVFAV